MGSVREVLRNKVLNQGVYAVSAADTVLDAIRLLAEKNIGALPVVEGRQLVGIISERDYARKLVLKGRSSAVTQVREIMSSPVIVVAPGCSVEYCMGLMTEHHLRHLPVVDDDEIIGLLSIGDLVKETIAEQARLIEKFEQYIRGE